MKNIKKIMVSALTFLTLILASNTSYSYLVVIDGINIPANIPGVDPYLDDTAYLFEHISSRYLNLFDQKLGGSTSFTWSNDVANTEYEVGQLSDRLREKYNESRKHNKPFVILSHSWGTVLAYCALKNNPDIVVDKLITLGSPLRTRYIDLRKAVKYYAGLDSIKALENIYSWDNYLAKKDPIASVIDCAGANIYVGTAYMWGHRTYYKDQDVWNNILNDAFVTNTIIGKWDTKIYYHGELRFSPVWTLYDSGKITECIEDGCESGKWSFTGSPDYSIKVNFGYAVFTGTVDPLLRSMKGTLKNDYMGRGTWNASR